MPIRYGPKSGNYAAAFRLLASFFWTLVFFLGPSPAVAQEAVRIAVLPFHLARPAAAVENLELGMVESLSTALANTPPFVLPQRQRLQQALREIRPGPIDVEGVVRIGTVLGVQAVLTGVLDADTDGLHITAHFVDIAGQSAKKEIISGPLGNVFDLQVRVVRKWLEVLGITLSPERWARLEGTLKSTSLRRAYDYHLQGRASQMKGTPAGWSEAITWYNKAIAEDGRYALALARLSETLTQIGQEKGRKGEDPLESYSQALEYGHRAVELAPDLLEARRGLGLIYLLTGKLDLAQAELQRALQLHANDPETWYLLWKTTDRANPESSPLQEALRLDPSFVPALRDLGVLHYDAGRYDQAIHLFQRILATHPQEAIIHYNLGLAYRRKNWLDKAQTELQQAVRFAPAFADASYALGTLYLQRGLVDEAIGAFRAAVGANPRHGNAYFYLGSLYLKKGQLEPALAAFQKAEELNPRDADSPLNAGNVYLEMGKWEQALERYQRAVELRPEYANAHYNLGLVLSKLGRSQEAIEAYERYLQYAPKAPDAQKVRNLIRKLRELL